MLATYTVLAAADAGQQESLLPRGRRQAPAPPRPSSRTCPASPSSATRRSCAGWPRSPAGTPPPCGAWPPGRRRSPRQPRPTAPAPPPPPPAPPPSPPGAAGLRRAAPRLLGLQARQGLCGGCRARLQLASVRSAQRGHLAADLAAPRRLLLQPSPAEGQERSSAGQGMAGYARLPPRWRLREQQESGRPASQPPWRPPSPSPHAGVLLRARLQLRPRRRGSLRGGRRIRPRRQ